MPLQLFILLPWCDVTRAGCQPGRRAGPHGAGPHGAGPHGAGPRGVWPVI